MRRPITLTAVACLALASQLVAGVASGATPTDSPESPPMPTEAAQLIGNVLATLPPGPATFGGCVGPGDRHRARLRPRPPSQQALVRRALLHRGRLPFPSPVPSVASVVRAEGQRTGRGPPGTRYDAPSGREDAAGSSREGCPMRRLLAPLALLLALGLAGPAAGSAQDATPVAPAGDAPAVLPPDAPAYGATFAEWSARHWQWALSFPAPISPLTDESGGRCGYGQAGPVFFLSGSPHAGVAYQCTVPHGVAIHAWVSVAECSTVEPPPYFGRDEAGLRACVAALADATGAPTASVDGVAVPDLGPFRVQSPVFRVALPADNLLGAPPSTIAAAVSDGYWLLLAPLPPGAHEVRVGGTLADGSPAPEATFRLTVAEPVVVEPAAEATPAA